MWYFKCSNSSKYAEEYHTKEAAEEGQWLHEMYVLSKTEQDCSGEHEISDDGKPCDYEKFTGNPCQFEYVPAVHFEDDYETPDLENPIHPRPPKESE